MKIRRLKLSGFKSFVEPAELRIEDGLTGIVGPNGCGKSNLLEAIRWVMGESSARSMRGAGMEDVIFAGTTTRPARSFAEVSILTETAAAAALGSIGSANDGDVEVVRRIERGAGSAYRVNGRDVRAKDVALLFADAATGAHSPALVSQGKISAVIAAKPAERRQMLEEAAGIAGLHVRRKDAEQKLRATEANLTRLDELLADMEVRAQNLRRQAKQAERYRKLSAEIRIAEGRLIYARWRDAAAAADTAKKEAEAAEALVTRAAEAQRAAAAWQADTTKVLAERRAAALVARERASEAGHQLTALRTERTALDRRITELAAQRARMDEDRDREGALARDAAEALARLGDEARTLDRRVADAEKGRPALERAVIEAETAARDAEVELARALAAQAGEQAEARVAQAALATARARLERAERECQRLAGESAALGDEAPLVAAREAAAAARQSADAEAIEATAAIERAEADRAAAAERRDLAQSAVAAAQAALSALEGEAKALRRAVDQQGTGNRLLDRIKAAPGYERALAAALGDDLDAALGEDGPRYWAGTDTYKADPALPEGVACLADHVEAPAQIARRLAQIGVVDTDSGIALAVGQRLVTLGGVLRRWDGYVAREGGAAAAERLIRLNRLAEIEAHLPDAEAAVAHAAQDAEAARSGMDAARAAADAARAALTRAEQVTRAAAREEDQAQGQIERLTARRAEMAERIARADAERGEAGAEAQSAEATVTALPDGSATATLVASLQAGNESARTKVAQLKAESATLDRSIAADRERHAAALAEAKGWRARAGEAAKRVEDLAKRAEAAEKEALTLADAPAALDGRIGALEVEVAQLSVAAQALADAEREAEAELRKTETASAQAGEALAEAREQRAGAVARAENQEARRIEMGRISGERFECPPPVLPQKVGFVSAEVGASEDESARLDRLSVDRERIGPVNLVAEQELAEIEAERATSAAEREELGLAINRLRGSIGNLNREGRQRLLAAFEAVNGHFSRLFATLFNGGQAHLELVDSDDPLEAGLEIMAQPPGKKLTTLTLLSGGEQALTAVALIFGLFLTNPAPICVLDEVDAPLDDANIERFCDLLDAMTRETETRYLIVTHNAVTMSRMHRLFGVTMVEQGVSRLVSVDLGGAEQLLAAE
ncbi:chromosome segregation protein SMC [Sphingomonas sp. LaA6.9]|uniref:chromosome segregation protein SMC n=1 Tax=Sphingomonas sp. LaA6.9 TaxID=2919914 RepID=UPI001F503BA7|nr:chromosome segregation protein SMC [Sphingomonas sp. LaA6.9]MCJ8157965.1 chromosome segregation protein SMC [Sphingomonas sp. LaA6.9]